MLLTRTDEDPVRRVAQRLSPNVAVLGLVSLLMRTSAAMMYGLLPIFLVAVTNGARTG
jgi:hypothetical protein